MNLGATVAVLVVVIAMMTAVWISTKSGDEVIYSPEIAVGDVGHELPHRGHVKCDKRPMQQRADEALSKIAWPWETLAYEYRFEGPRKGLLGKVNFGTKVITTYVRNCQTTDQLAHVVAHEVGHALDLKSLTNEDRKRWLELRGIPAETEWYPGCFCSDYRFGSGDFAEVFAYLVAPHALKFESKLGKPPAPEQTEQLREFFR